MKYAASSSAAPEASGVRFVHKTIDIPEILKSRESGSRIVDLSRSVALSKATVYRILATLPRRTANTISTKTGLLAQLARVRNQGYAIDDQENEFDGRCIGAPIQARDGQVFANVSISGPVFRMDMKLAKSLAPPRKAGFAEIGEAARRG